MNIQTNNKLNDNGLNKKSERINLFSNNLKISNRRRKFKTKSSISSTMAKFENKEEKKENNDNKNNINDIPMNDLNNISSNKNKDKYKETG